MYTIFRMYTLYSMCSLVRECVMPGTRSRGLRTATTSAGHLRRRPTPFPPGTCSSDNVAMVVDNSSNGAPRGRLWLGATHTRLLIATGTFSLVAGTLGGVAWIRTQRLLWSACSASLSYGNVERHVVNALLLSAGVAVAISVLRMSRDSTSIGRVQAIVYWGTTAILWVLLLVVFTSGVDIRACSQSLFL